MATLYLKFEKKVLKEIALQRGVITIGRMPGNLVQIDNPAVSGRHAKVYWEADQYLVEDNNSSNGTFVNNQRVGKTALKDGDLIRVGKHTLEFRESATGGAKAPQKAVDRAPHWQNQLDKAPTPPQLEPTALMGQGKLSQLLGSAAPKGKAAAATAAAKIATLVVQTAGANDSEYVLTDKIVTIGKSKLATIKLKGWFAPDVAAVINRKDGKYFVAPGSPGIAVTVNEKTISGNTELSDGDVVAIAGVQMKFRG